jgi:hypothetical protein
MDIIDVLFPLIAVFSALFLWNSESRAISLLLAGDFVLFFAIEGAWILSDIPGGTWILPFKGIVYILLFGAYLSVLSRPSLWLAGLSGFIGLVHCANPMLLHYGTGLTEGNYGFIMGLYCILQFIVFFGGINYGTIHKYFSDNPWFNHNRHGHKGA